MDLLNIIFGTFGVLGVITSLLLYSRAKKEKIPMFDIRKNVILDKKLSSFEGVELQYNSESVKELAEVFITFYNRGKEVILKEDTTVNDRIRIEIAEGNILGEPSVLYISNQSTNLSIAVSDDKQDIYINFDYLDKYDGIVLRFFTNTARTKNISVLGKIKGLSRFYDRRDRMEGLPITHSIINGLGSAFGLEPTPPMKVIILISSIILIPITVATTIIDILGIILKLIFLPHNNEEDLKSKFNLAKYDEHWLEFRDR